MLKLQGICLKVFLSDVSSKFDVIEKLKLCISNSCGNRIKNYGFYLIYPSVNSWNFTLFDSVLLNTK
jgi:hypothetical protein